MIKKTAYSALRMATLICIAIGFGCTGENENQLPNVGRSTAVIAPAFPVDLALASVMESLDKTLFAKSKYPAALPFSARREELLNLIEGETQCSFSFSLSSSPSRPECYGPRVRYINHPDAFEEYKDENDIDDDTGTGDLDGDDEFPDGDLGIWDAQEGEKACMASVMDHQAEIIVHEANSGLSGFGAIYCQMLQSDQVLPDSGFLDVTDLTDDAFARSGLALERASIEETNGTYISYFRAKGDVSFREQSAPATVSCRLHHKATQSDGYIGKIACEVGFEEWNDRGNCGEDTSGITRSFSLAYNKNSSSAMEMDVLAADSCGGKLDSRSTTHVSADSITVDLAKRHPAASDGWAHNASRNRLAFDPNTGFGTFASLWQAGSLDGASRGVLMDVYDDDALTRGCGHFGFAASIENGELSPSGMYCAWAGPGPRLLAPIPLLQRQCFTSDPTVGEATSDTSSQRLLFAPTASCESSGFDGNGRIFAFGNGSRVTDGPMSHELLPLEEASLTSFLPMQDIDEWQINP